MNLAKLDPDAPLCASGKHPHRDEATALSHLRTARYTAAAGIRNGRKPGRTESSVYRCAACGWWHLTAMTARRQRRKV